MEIWNLPLGSVMVSFRIILKIFLMPSVAYSQKYQVRCLSSYQIPMKKGPSQLCYVGYIIWSVWPCTGGVMPCFCRLILVTFCISPIIAMKIYSARSDHYFFICAFFLPDCKVTSDWGPFFSIVILSAGNKHCVDYGTPNLVLYWIALKYVFI